MPMPMITCSENNKGKSAMPGPIGCCRSRWITMYTPTLGRNSSRPVYIAATGRIASGNVELRTKPLLLRIDWPPPEIALRVMLNRKTQPTMRIAVWPAFAPPLPPRMMRIRKR